jgi:hypothetical protein
MPAAEAACACTVVRSPRRGRPTQERAGARCSRRARAHRPGRVGHKHCDRGDRRACTGAAITPAWVRSSPSVSSAPHGEPEPRGPERAERRTRKDVVAWPAHPPLGLMPRARRHGHGQRFSRSLRARARYASERDGRSGSIAPERASALPERAVDVRDVELARDRHGRDGRQRGRARGLHVAGTCTTRPTATPSLRPSSEDAERGWSWTVNALPPSVAPRLDGP